MLEISYSEIIIFESMIIGFLVITIIHLYTKGKVIKMNSRWYEKMIDKGIAFKCLAYWRINGEWYTVLCYNPGGIGKNCAEEKTRIFQTSQELSPGSTYRIKQDYKYSAFAHIYEYSLVPVPA